MISDEELLARWPGVRLDADNAAYYAGLSRHELILRCCSDCGWWHHPPRPVCPKCWSWNVVPSRISGEGVVVLVTRRATASDAEPERPVVAIELSEQAGLRISGELVAPEDVEVRPGLVAKLRWEERSGNPAPVWSV